jgi:hypothetical protein
VRDLFDGFCDTLLGSAPRGNVVARVEAAGQMFSRMDAAFADPAEVDRRSLRSLLGAAGLRRAEGAVAHVSGVLGVSWEADDDPTGLDGDVGPCRSAGTPGREDLLEAFASHLAARPGRALKPRTRLLYVAAAHALLVGARAAGRATPDTRDVRRMLRRTPGARASVWPFVTWLRASGRVGVWMPRRRRPHRKLVERRTIAGARLLVGVLAREGDGPRGRALLAACLSLLFAIPLGRVLALRGAQVDRGGPVVLWPLDDALELPAEIEPAFRRLTDDRAAGLLFPGRTGLRPASTSGVRHHVTAVLGRRRPASDGISRVDAPPS